MTSYPLIVLMMQRLDMRQAIFEFVLMRIHISEAINGIS